MQLLLSIACVGVASALSATTAPKTPSTRVKLPHLKAEAFRHPLDKDVTAAVQRSPLRFFETAVRTGLAPPLEQMTRLDNLATGVKVTERQYPELHASFQEAIACLGGLDPQPELFVKSDPRPNAYTLALRGGAPFVVVTSALVDGFSAAETQAVLGHELGAFGVRALALVLTRLNWFYVAAATAGRRRGGRAPPAGVAQGRGIFV